MLPSVKAVVLLLGAPALKCGKMIFLKESLYGGLHLVLSVLFINEGYGEGLDIRLLTVVDAVGSFFRA